MTIKPKKEPMIFVGARIPRRVLERLEKRAKKMAGRAGCEITLAAALRAVLEAHA